MDPLKNTLRKFLDFNPQELEIEDNSFKIVPDSKAFNPYAIASIVRKALKDFMPKSEADFELIENIKRKLAILEGNSKSLLADKIAADRLNISNPPPASDEIAGAGAASEVVESPLETDPYLDYTKRPPAVTELMAKKFDYLIQTEPDFIPEYDCTGNVFADRLLLFSIAEYENYCLSESDLVKQYIIEKSNSGQSDFVFLDIGCGYGYKFDYIINSLDKDKDIPEDFNITFVNTTIDRHFSSTKKTKKCTLHFFRDFDANNLELELRKRDLNVENRIDLIFSEMCFMHLADPLGTLTQAYNLLRPGGIMVIDFFSISLGNRIFDKDQASVFLFSLFNDAFLPYQNGIIMQKREESNTCKLPFNYKGISEANKKVCDYEYTGMLKIEESEIKIKRQLNLYKWLLTKDLYKPDHYHNKHERNYEPARIAAIGRRTRLNQACSRWLPHPYPLNGKEFKKDDSDTPSD